jgi:16S rRNA (adenine1518-N6/adenine1519-N6)-dimethyltransferase
VEGVRQLLRRYDLRPKKSLGQSFLVDEEACRRIVRAAAIEKQDWVLEIGAGLGVMTKMIATQARQTLAVEVDPPLIAVLKEELKGMDQVKVVEEDILHYSFPALEETGGGKIKVIGNIPYNISSPILFKLIENRARISRAVLMVQREAGERWQASCGGRDYGIPSVMLALHASSRALFALPPESFFPRPRVQSLVLVIDFLPHTLVSLEDEDFFARLVKKSFAQRRKTLWNNLKSLAGEGLAGLEIAAVLADLSIDGKRRAETLSPTELGHLANAFWRRRKEKS